MSKKTKYYISFTVDAMSRAVVEGPKGLSRDEVMDIVSEQNAWPYTGVCHQCANDVQVADIIEEVEISSEEGSVWDRWSHEKKKNEENQKVIDEGKDLVAELVPQLSCDNIELIEKLIKIAEGKR